MDIKFVPRLFTSYYKLFYDWFKYPLKRNQFKQHQMLKRNFEAGVCKTLESAGEMKLMITFYLKLHTFSELWNLVFLIHVPMGNCCWCFIRQLFISLAIRKSKKGSTKTYRIVSLEFFNKTFDSGFHCQLLTLILLAYCYTFPVISVMQIPFTSRQYSLLDNFLLPNHASDSALKWKTIREVDKR